MQRIVITLISKKDISGIVKTQFKVKLKAMLYRLQFYQKGTFPTHFFLGIFRVTA